MSELVPPVAPPRPHPLNNHGETRIDPYYWLRDDDRQDPEVLAYLQAENAYTEAVLAPTRPLQQTLYQEMRGRLKPDDCSLPYFERGYWYVTRYQAEGEHPVYERHAGALSAPAECLLDADARGRHADYYDVGDWEVSPDNRWLLVSEDWLSRRQYRISVRELPLGEWQDEGVEHTSGELVWTADSQAFFYVKLEEETLLPYQVWLHRLGTPVEQDRLIYEEEDDSFYLSIEPTRSAHYLCINLSSTLTSEVWLVPLAEPERLPCCFRPRESGHEYQVDHLDADFYIRSNQDGRNFGLYHAAAPGAAWHTLQAPEDQVLLQGYELFQTAILVEERIDGLTRLRQLDRDARPIRTLSFADPAYVTWLAFNPDPATQEVRYGYSSLTTPHSTYALDLQTGEQRLLRQQVVLGDFKSEAYHSERIWIPARDGVSVPVSLVYRRDRRVVGGNPLLIYGYGAYGLSEDPDFSSNRLSLLDRGVVFAIAHIRGGEELGRDWYEQGRREHKLNSFHDFIDVTSGLVKLGYGDPQKVFAMGGSAGGLLMGAVINMAPELYCGVVASVPFVDVLTSMLDDSIPLTTGEYDEWGNPNEPDDYALIRAYSPYDQVRAQAYPHLLVVSGLHDSQVQYWEPAKWVAKLRSLKTDPHWLLLSMDMSAGHGGKAGRYAWLEDLAREYAFVLWLADKM